MLAVDGLLAGGRSALLPGALTDRLLTVTGRFGLEAKADKGLFFRVGQALAR
jgi:hypothetical protein